VCIIFSLHLYFQRELRIEIPEAWRIEPIACGEREWLEDDSRAIIEIARREGEVITLEPEAV